MYKDKEKQKEANRQGSQRRRDKQKSTIFREGIVIPDYPVPIVPSAIPSYGVKAIDPARMALAEVNPALTMAEVIKALTPGKCLAILDSWYEGKGTEYQRRLAVLGGHYAQA